MTLLGRMEAVRTFAALPEAEALAAANKRITNILRKTDEAHRHGRYGAVPRKTPRRAARRHRTRAVRAWKRPSPGGDFTGALRDLAQLRDAVDRFFNDVMVMAEDARLRANRLALLATLHTLANRVADISKLAAWTGALRCHSPSPAL